MKKFFNLVGKTLFFIFNLVKKSPYFILNLMIFMFFRKLLKEHICLLVMVLAVSSAIGGLLWILFSLSIVSLASEPLPFISWVSDIVTSLLDIKRISYISFTYIIALSVYLHSDDIIKFQNKRDLIPLNILRKELKVNSRAVLITMNGALSLTFKLFIGMLLILSIINSCADVKTSGVISMTFSELMTSAFGFLLADLCLFFIGKFLVAPFDSYLGSTTKKS